ncbi:TetR family transcriptional regulator [Ruminococcaceae bacterium R-25]|nr:TetR family transcriptional regulator [Ruminococcaceae bacterium R-25]SUQ11721.1 transcriptional regulator, TetR family [Oscillospiraceae bacterium]
MPKTEQQCQQIREDTRNRILKESSLYFARNGFGDTKIGDLAKHIGIGQGTIYLYFKSKEELFEEIRKSAENKDEIKRLKTLSKLPIPAKTKIEKISAEMEKKLKNDEEYVVRITILSQLLLEQEENLYKNDLYKVLAEIVKQGQKEGSVVKGDALYLADLYWGTVYMYALKKLFVPGCKMVTKDTLFRLLVK